MTVFVDTSGLYALLSATDADHHRAEEIWNRLESRAEPLTTSNYVVVETTAVLQRRLGLNAVRDFLATFVPLLDIRWIDSNTHARAVTALLTAGRRDLSMVDCVSFEVMRGEGIQRAFAFDAHFLEQGFQCL